MIKVENFIVTHGDSGVISTYPIKNRAESDKTESTDEKKSREDAEQFLRFHIQILKPDNTQEISVSEFAHEAGVTPQAVRKMIAEGRLHAKMLGNQYVIERDELYRYLKR